MTKKELVLSAFKMEKMDRQPVMPHWWGLYKFQHAGIIKGSGDQDFGWRLSGRELADVDIRFYNDFDPDIFHLSTGFWKPQPGDEERNKARLELAPAVRELESKRIIDEYVKLTTPKPEEYISSGMYDHVGVIASKYSDDVLILLNEGNPVCGVFDNGGPAGDFQDALIATVTNPENLGYLIYKLYEANLPRMKVLKESGVHGYIGSETCVSHDIISPNTYRSIVAPALKMYYRSLKEMGLYSVVYFTGDVLPLIDDITEIGADALMVEDEKKNYNLNIVDIYKKINRRMALFGNVNSVTEMLYGSINDVIKETKRQCRGTGTGFIAATGSPICLDTPEDNIQTFIKTAREF